MLEIIIQHAIQRRRLVLVVVALLSFLGLWNFSRLPIDAVPDLLVGIGFTDDVTVLLAALAMVGTHITNEHRDKAKRALAGDEDTSER